MPSDPENKTAPAGEAGAAGEFTMKPEPLASDPIQTETPSRVGKVSKVTDIPEVARYAQRIGAVPRSLRKLVIEERDNGYPRTVAIIRFNDEGDVEAPADYLPDVQEAAAIKAAWKLVKWPEYRPFLHTGRSLPRHDRLIPWSMADDGMVHVVQDGDYILCVEDDLLPRNHAIGKLARQMETSDAARPIYRGSDHWRAARA